jgi:AcrR family transcriptional regulator
MVDRPQHPVDLVTAGDVLQVAERVLSVAKATFAEFGWRDSTVDAVCRRADITSSQFYTVYDTVDDLFVEMYRREAEARVSALKIAIQPLTDGLAGSSPATIIPPVAAALSAATSDRDWWIITTEYMLRAVRHPDVATTYRGLRRQTNRAMADVIRAALQAAYVDEQVDVYERFDINQFVEIITALHRGAVTNNLLEPESSNPQLLDERVWTAILDSYSD